MDRIEIHLRNTHPALHINFKDIRLLFADTSDRDLTCDDIRVAYLSWYTHCSWLFDEVSRSVSDSLHTKLRTLKSEEKAQFQLSLVYDDIPSVCIDRTERHLVVSCTPTTLTTMQTTVDHYLKNISLPPPPASSKP